MDEKYRFPKSMIIERLTDNLAQHRTDYTEARAGYLAEVQRRAAEISQVANEGKKPGDLLRQLYTLSVPSSHVDDYETALDFLDLDTRDEIELDEERARQWLRDQWNWKGNFVTTNSAYSSR